VKGRRSVTDVARSLGRSGVTVSGLGFGGAPVGNLFEAVTDGDALDTIDAAWTEGVRYFDTAPHYGLGLSERRLGAALRDRPRSRYTVSTKVGRLLIPNPGGERDSDLPNGFDVPAALRRHWDFSGDGVRRSLEQSLDRLGLERVDIVLLHDPDESGDLDGAVGNAYPVLHDLRAAGVIGAVGVGSKQVNVLKRFITETDLDTIMLAGRYTLLEQPALDELLPACEKRGVCVLNVGIFNSGLLATEWPAEDGHYEYATAPPDLVDRARRIATVCRAHGTSLPHAALAFAGAHPSVGSVVVGAARADHVRRNARLWQAPPPPAALWQDLRAQGLLRPDAPVPS